MRPPLQAISTALATLQQPENLLQLAVIVGAVVLGWWAARFARARITVAADPENLPDRLRELLFIGAPPAMRTDRHRRRLFRQDGRLQRPPLALNDG